MLGLIWAFNGEEPLYGTGLIEDDLRILPGIRFRADRLLPAARALSRFIRYLEKYPRAHPSARFIT